MSAPALAIFAKAPVPGEVKTRMFPHLTPEQAAELQRAFILDTLHRMRPSGDVERFLACYPSSTHVFFKRLSQDDPVQLIDQPGDDLGERMAHVIRALVDRGYERTVLIGTDSPTLPVAYLEEAFDVLKRRPVVLGPSHDGGYYLIGLSKWVPEIFENISWSTPRVFGQTLEKIRQLKLGCGILPEWFDVDDFNGLKALAAQLSQEPHLASHTWKFLQSHRPYTV